MSAAPERDLSRTTVAAMMRDMPKGQARELAAQIAEGQRKAGMPEE